MTNADATVRVLSALAAGYALVALVRLARDAPRATRRSPQVISVVLFSLGILVYGVSRAVTNAASVPGIVRIASAILFLSGACGLLMRRSRTAS